MSSGTAEISLLPGGQHDFVTSEAKYPCMTGGYGSGKTFGFVMRAINELQANAEVMSDRTPIVLMEPTYPMVRDILVPELTYWLDVLGWEWSYLKTDHRLIVEDWGHLLLLSAENYRRYVGLNLCAFGVDELDTIQSDKARSMWRVMISRLRVAGSTATGFVAGTPEGYGFMHEGWDESARHDRADGEDYALYRASSRDNRHLPDGFVDSLIRNYDERLVQAYVDGRFVNLTGVPAVYAFDRGIHVKPLGEPCPRQWVGLDFNVAKMVAVLCHEYADGTLHYADEIVLRNSGSTQRMSELIRERWPAAKEVYPDPAGKARSTNSTASDHQILKEAGYQVCARHAHPSHRDRLAALNAKLKNAEGRVTMFVAPCCTELIKDLEQTQRDSAGGIAKGDAERTHALDACSYAIEMKYPVARRAVTATQRWG